MRHLFSASLVLLSLLPVCSAKEKSTTLRLQAANLVLSDMTKMSDKGVPLDLIEKAQCVVVVPNLKKGGFILGAKYGKGFVSCRKPGAAGWTAPAAVRIEGGSFGLQIGASENDVILLVMNESGQRRLLESKFTLGGDATVAAGPVGRATSAQTDAKLTAQILSYSRARGVFAGLTLDGATLREDVEDNEEMYGSKLTNHEVLEGKIKASTPAGQKLVATLGRFSRRKG